MVTLFSKTGLLAFIFFLITSFNFDKDITIVIESARQMNLFINSDSQNYSKIIIRRIIMDYGGTSNLRNDSIFKRILENDNLFSLELFACNLELIPDLICLNKNLKRLDLVGNQISFPNFNICKLKKLEVLDLGYNKIIDLGSFVTSIKNNKKLSNLCFSNNLIDSIPETICNLDSLKYLYLDFNKIRNLPCCLSNFDGFQLDIAFNPIKEIPCCFSKSYKRWYYLHSDLKQLTPMCFKDTIIPKSSRIQIY